MVIRFMYIIRDHIFKGQHPFCIHIPRARDQVLLIGILPGELEPDQMAPVIEPAAVHIVIILILPAGRFYGTDIPALFCRHGLLAHTGFRRTAAPKFIKLAVFLKGLRRQFIILKLRLVVIDLHIGVSAVFGHFRQRSGGLDLCAAVLLQELLQIRTACCADND